MDYPSGITELAEWQDGVVTRQQLLAAGFSQDAILHRLERGRWQQLYRGVYALFTGPSDRMADLWAAVLRAGPGAVLSHHTAAELHGLVSKPGDAIHVTVPATRRIKVQGIMVHISGRIADAVQPNRAPLRTSIEETTLDLTQLARGFDGVCGWITGAIANRLTTEERIRTAMAARKKMRWRLELDEILNAAGSGIHSALEYRYIRDVERKHRLPESQHQVRVTIDGRSAYRDVYYEEFKVAVELDGKFAHPDVERERDRHRDVVASAEGVQTCRYGWSSVAGHPCETAVLQARVLRERGWRGTPHPCRPGCPVVGAFAS